MYPVRTEEMARRKQLYLATTIPIIHFLGIEPLENILEQAQIFPDDGVWCEFQDSKFMSWVVQLRNKVCLICLIYLAFV